MSSCPECQRRGQGEGALVSSPRGPVCAVCGWGRGRIEGVSRRGRRRGRTSRSARPQPAPRPILPPLQLSTDEANRRAILAALEQHGPMSEDRISQLIEVGIKSVSARMLDLMKRGLVVKTSMRVTNASGRSAAVYALASQAKAQALDEGLAS